MRKFWFAYLAKALVVFPGGFGTLDEVFEILTLVQTQKLSKQLKVILYGSHYWDQILHLQPMVEWGAIHEDELKLMEKVDTPKRRVPGVARTSPGAPPAARTPAHDHRDTATSPRRKGDQRVVVRRSAPPRQS